MIKNGFIGILLLSTNGLFAQISEVEKCGLDDSAQLNQFEAGYFNEVFKEEKADFDFSGKVVAFYTGSSGTTASTKSNYFKVLSRSEEREDQSIHEWQAGGTQLLILTHAEKEASGGYDAILISWSKLLKEGKSREKLINELKNRPADKTNQ